MSLGGMMPSCLPNPSPPSDEAAIAAFAGGTRAGKVAFTARPTHIPRTKAVWYADGAQIFVQMVMKKCRRRGIGCSLIATLVDAIGGSRCMRWRS